MRDACDAVGNLLAEVEHLNHKPVQGSTVRGAAGEKGGRAAFEVFSEILQVVA